MWLQKSPLDLHETMPVYLPESALVQLKTPFGLQWLKALGVLCIALIRHWAGQPVHTETPTACCCETHAQNAGEAWAKKEERRFNSPKCC
jgi:hypothetical protein